jgi:hypothetical protein
MGPSELACLEPGPVDSATVPNIKAVRNEPTGTAFDVHSCCGDADWIPSKIQLLKEYALSAPRLLSPLLPQICSQMKQCHS